MIFLELLLAVMAGWAIERALMIISARNMSSPYNGYGCIDLVNRKDVKAPMAYRVLVPWLFRLFPGADRGTLYVGAKTVLNAAAIFLVAQAWSWEVALLVAVLVVPTFEFDYWDWAVELAGVAAVMTGNLTLAVVFTVLWALSRETVLIAPVMWFVVFGDVTGTAAVLAAAVAPFLAVRAYVGRRELYCSRFMVRQNLADLKPFFKWKPLFMSPIFTSVLITGLCLSVVVFQPVGWIFPLVFLGAGWVLARATEPRVFTACLPWIAVTFLNLIGG